MVAACAAGSVLRSKKAEHFLYEKSQTVTPVHPRDEWMDIPVYSRLDNLRAHEFSIRDAENIAILTAPSRARSSQGGALQPMYGFVQTNAAIDDLAQLLSEVYDEDKALSVDKSLDNPLREVLIWKPETPEARMNLYLTIAQAWEEVMTADGRPVRYPNGLAASMMRVAVAPVGMETAKVEPLQQALAKSQTGQHVWRSLEAMHRGTGSETDAKRLRDYVAALPATTGVDEPSRSLLQNALQPVADALARIPQPVLAQGKVTLVAI